MTRSRPNTSTAVRQRRTEAHDSLDDFPTHPWATRALCEMLTARGHALHLAHACDPACNRGFMARPLGEYFDRVFASDIHDYGYKAMDARADFLADFPDDSAGGIDWIVTNPPFTLADQFIRVALSYARIGVAVFVRSAFDEGKARYDQLFRDLPEAYAFPFVERVPLHRGKLRDPARRYWVPDTGEKAEPWDGAWKYPSTATAYQWLVWLNTDRPQSATASAPATEKTRIAPCRKRLTRPGDYPIRYADEEGAFTPPPNPNETADMLHDLRGAGL